MPMLLFGRLALLAYCVGLVLSIIHNIYNGQGNFHKPVSDRKDTALLILMITQKVIIYLSIIAIGYWAVMALGWVWGLLAVIGALFFQFQVGFFFWRRF